MQIFTTIEKAKVVEDTIKETNCYTKVQKTNMPIFRHMMDKEDTPAVSTVVLEVYFNCKAKELIIKEDWIGLLDYANTKIKFIYDRRKPHDHAQIKIAENAASTLQSAIFSCNNKHARLESYYPSNEARLKCPVCKGIMILKRPALIPNFGEILKIAATPEEIENEQSKPKTKRISKSIKQTNTNISTNTNIPSIEHSPIPVTSLDS